MQLWFFLFFFKTWFHWRYLSSVIWSWQYPWNFRVPMLHLLVKDSVLKYVTISYNEIWANKIASYLNHILGRNLYEGNFVCILFLNQRILRLCLKCIYLTNLWCFRMRNDKRCKMYDMCIVRQRSSSTPCIMALLIWVWYFIPFSPDSCGMPIFFERNRTICYIWFLKYVASSSLDPV